MRMQKRAAHETASPTAILRHRALGPTDSEGGRTPRIDRIIRQGISEHAHHSHLSDSGQRGPTPLQEYGFAPLGTSPHRPQPYRQFLVRVRPGDAFDSVWLATVTTESEDHSVGNRTPPTRHSACTMARGSTGPGNLHSEVTDPA